jgi:hypothetical protein
MKTIPSILILLSLLSGCVTGRAAADEPVTDYLQRYADFQNELKRLENDVFSYEVGQKIYAAQDEIPALIVETPIGIEGMIYFSHFGAMLKFIGDLRLHMTNHMLWYTIGFDRACAESDMSRPNTVLEGTITSITEIIEQYRELVTVYNHAAKYANKLLSKYAINPPPPSMPYLPVP